MLDNFDNWGARRQRCAPSGEPTAAVAPEAAIAIAAPEQAKATSKGFIFGPFDRQLTPVGELMR